MNLLLPSSTVENWFDRCVGTFVSYRRYLYLSSSSTGLSADPVSQGIRTEFITGKQADRCYFISWESQHEDGTPASAGTMNIRLVGDRISGFSIERDRTYFDESITNSLSKLSMVDRDTMVFNSVYGGNHYREEIRFLSGDDIRLRQTVGFSARNHKARLVGQYFEQRIK